MDAKLKSLKVVDLKTILSHAGVSVPAKANKNDLIARIQGSQEALSSYAVLHGGEPDAAPAQEEPEFVSEQPESVTEASEPPPSPPKAESAQLSETQVQDAEAPVSADEHNTDPPSTEAAVVDPELEARKRRAERFGIPLVEPKPAPKKPAARAPKVVPATKVKVNTDEKVLAERAARFGLKDKAKPVQPAAAAPGKQNGRKRTVAQAEPAVDAEEEEKRRKRAERFGIPPKA